MAVCDFSFLSSISDILDIVLWLLLFYAVWLWQLFVFYRHRDLFRLFLYQQVCCKLRLYFVCFGGQQQKKEQSKYYSDLLEKRRTIAEKDQEKWVSLLLYLTLPPGWAGSYTCPALRPYQLGPMHIPECNHKVTGSGYKAVDGCKAVLDGCEAVNRRLWSHK